MKASRTILILSILIIVLSALATCIAVFWHGGGQSFAFTTIRGETVSIYGQGLYRYDSLVMASQGIAQDIVTLFVGIPLLIVALVFYERRSLRGQVLLTGTLGYFLYTYTSCAFGLNYNPLFLVYVALFSLSLFAFILSIGTIDVAELPAHFGAGLPRRGIAVFLFAVGLFLLVNWLGHTVPALLQNKTPDLLLSNTTLFIQVLDLGLLVPVAFLSCVLLWRKNAWGYLLASVVLVKGFTMGIALTAMVIGQALAQVQMGVADVLMFPAIALIDIAMTYLLLKNLRGDIGSLKPAKG